jgi:hypothetical protein
VSGLASGRSRRSFPLCTRSIWLRQLLEFFNLRDGQFPLAPICEALSLWVSWLWSRHCSCILVAFLYQISYQNCQVDAIRGTQFQSSSWESRDEYGPCFPRVETCTADCLAGILTAGAVVWRSACVRGWTDEDCQTGTDVGVYGRFPKGSACVRGWTNEDCQTGTDAGVYGRFPEASWCQRPEGIIGSTAD